MRGILIVCEVRAGVASPLTRELLGLGRQLATECDCDVAAVLIAPDDRAMQELIAHGADRVYVCERDGTQDYQSDVWVPLVVQAAREAEPLAILAGHTPAGADLAPRLAIRLESAVAMGCVAVEAEGGKLLFTRPCYGGNLRETLSFNDAAPAVATIRAGLGTAHADPNRQGDVVRVPAPIINLRVRVIARERDTSDALRLDDAKIVVAGGRGLEGPEGFRALEHLARILGAAVGSSRVPCELGWCPHAWQIGLTGRTVSPELYIAVGISGAGHHMAGCGNAKTIVAINSDPDAAIFKQARFGIVGDYRKVVPALADAVQALKNS